MFRRSRVGLAAAMAVGGLAATATSVMAQDAQRVEITGSAISRVAGETALPVTIIKVEDLTKQGVTTAEQALTRISSNQSTLGASASIGGTTGGKSGPTCVA
jgi:iron complex outermembrane receptor protein